MLKVRAGDVDDLERTIRASRAPRASPAPAPPSCCPPSGRTGSANCPEEARRARRRGVEVAPPARERGRIVAAGGSTAAAGTEEARRMDAGLSGSWRRRSRRRAADPRGRRGPLRVRRPGLARRPRARGADRQERRRHDFNVNRHLNLTNVCSASCAYCSFQRKPGEKDAYTMRVEEAVRLAKADGGRAPHRAAHRQRPPPDPALALLPALAEGAQGGAARRCPSRRSPPPRSTGSRRSPG